MDSERGNKPYYGAYEKRYSAAYSAGVKYWGFMPDNGELRGILADWVEENGLSGKQVVEFACGEGAAGVMLSELGCIYTGADYSPSALLRAAETLSDYPSATLLHLDLTRDCPEGVFFAALDIMGLHMLVTDSDREKYLSNMRTCLAPGASVLFLFENYRVDAYSGEIATFDDWARITGSDYSTPLERKVINNGVEYTVEVPLLPARAKNREDYITELERAGFAVERFVECSENPYCNFAAHIFARKI